MRERNKTGRETGRTKAPLEGDVSSSFSPCSEQTWLRVCSASSLDRSISCCCSTVWAKHSRNFTTSDNSWSRSFVTSSLNFSKSRILREKNTGVRLTSHSHLLRAPIYHPLNSFSWERLPVKDQHYFKCEREIFISDMGAICQLLTGKRRCSSNNMHNMIPFLVF